MIDERCLGADVDRSKIDPKAEVTGSSYLTGRLTAVARGAVVRDSRLHDVSVAAAAEVVDSIILGDGHEHSHRCDAAGRVTVRGCPRPEIASGARVAGSMLVNTSVGESSEVRDTWAKDVRFGARNRVTEAKLIITNCADDVTVAGPTEISEAYLGRGATIDRRGYYEGVFSNSFHCVEFDEATKRLRVARTIDLPHVSRYGTNTINSTNSGKLLGQPGGILSGFGPHMGLWRDKLLSHEQIELGPCAWVAPWTKVIGQSPEAHATDDEKVTDELMTYLMPFSVAGYGGQSTNGLVMPGELSNGFGPKQRKGAWVFTYAPDAVIRMVRRLHDALPKPRKAVADTIVEEAIKSALAVTRAMAARNSVDLGTPLAEQKRGWPRWIATTHALLSAHLSGGLWRFKGGEPVEWKRGGPRWVHPRMDAVLALAPDALEAQVSEEEMFRFEDPVPPASVAVPEGALELAGATGGEPRIDSSARVAPGAVIGPGCRIGRDAKVARGAFVWNSVIERCSIEEGAVVERSVVDGGAVGARSVVRSTRMKDSSLGADSTAECASLMNASLARQTTVSPFADVSDVTAAFATILGGAFLHTKMDVYLMSMHMAGGCRHMRALPRLVELNGGTVAVPAIPMLGGGSLIRGTRENPVELECSFIGSNAILEPGSFVGFGSFVLGTFGPDESSLPFTVSTGGGAGRHQLGAVLTAMPSVALTHFVSWTFQAVGSDGLGGRGGRAVAAMCVQAIEEAAAAIEWETARRRSGSPFEPPERFRRYRSLADYSDEQLASGLEAYRRALADGAWEMELRDGELIFSSKKGCWIERGGAAFWKENE